MLILLMICWKLFFSFSLCFYEFLNCRYVWGKGGGVEIKKFDVENKL